MPSCPLSPHICIIFLFYLFIFCTLCLEGEGLGRHCASHCLSCLLLHFCCGRKKGNFPGRRKEEWWWAGEEEEGRQAGRPALACCLGPWACCLRTHLPSPLHTHLPPHPLSLPLPLLSSSPHEPVGMNRQACHLILPFLPPLPSSLPLPLYRACARACLLEEHAISCSLMACIYLLSLPLCLHTACTLGAFAEIWEEGSFAHCLFLFRRASFCCLALVGEEGRTRASIITSLA